MQSACQVSIRSPHRSKGRLTSHIARADPGASASKFQSAPLTEARGDTTRTGHRRRSLPSTVFQSAPLTEARGDGLWRQRGLWISVRGFNPLPSPKQGETAQGGKFSGLPGFNPLPSPKQGETRCQRSRPSTPNRFNPLPSPKQGETGNASDASALARAKSFNPLPSPKQGETPVAITDGIPKSYMSGCANLLPPASYC